MVRPRRKDAEIERTRRHIVNAAVRVFARQGYAASSMQDIAAEAEYSAPSLYSYFRGKKAIFDALLVTLHDEIERLFDVTLPKGLTLAQKLELLLTPQSAWVDANREAFVFLSRREGMTLLVQSDEVEAPAHVGLFTNWFEAHTTVEERGGRTSEKAAFLMWGISHGLYTRWLLLGLSTSATALVAETIACFVGAISAPYDGGQ